MNFEEKILDLCTRATNVFVPIDLPDAMVSVGLSCHRDYPKVNHAWFVMYDGGGQIRNKTLDNHSLMECVTLSEALEDLEKWLLWQEFEYEAAINQGAAIVEEIGFGD